MGALGDFFSGFASKYSELAHEQMLFERQEQIKQAELERQMALEKYRKDLTAEDRAFSQQLQLKQEARLAKYQNAQIAQGKITANAAKTNAETNKRRVALGEKQFEAETAEKKRLMREQSKLRSVTGSGKYVKNEDGTLRELSQEELLNYEGPLASDKEVTLYKEREKAEILQQLDREGLIPKTLSDEMKMKLLDKAEKIVEDMDIDPQDKPAELSRVFQQLVYNNTPQTGKERAEAEAKRAAIGPEPPPVEAPKSAKEERAEQAVEQAKQKYKEKDFESLTVREIDELLRRWRKGDKSITDDDWAKLKKLRKEKKKRNKAL